MSPAASLHDPRPDGARTLRRPTRGQRARASGPRSLHAPLQFLGAFARAPLRVGAIWPSSRALARRVADCCDFRPGATVVELGAGTGAFTGLLLKRLSGRGRLLAVEINAATATVLRRRFPQCEVIQDSAANLPSHLNGWRADCIVSGLAWGNMLPRMQNQIFRAILKSLKPGGQFVAFAYVHAAWLPTSLRFRRRLLRHFQRVETTSVIWRNLPPAFVFRCWRR
jgi:phosphatidylethanolamine/phosphatidyl-N-methylethanolamine N-methyltransferase